MHVALLRGVDLGARNKVSMADLRTLIESLGAENVQTYVQSGNVVFKSRVRSAAKLAGDIERRIGRELGLEIQGCSSHGQAGEDRWRQSLHGE